MSYFKKEGRFNIMYCGTEKDYIHDKIILLQILLNEVQMNINNFITGTHNTNQRKLDERAVIKDLIKGKYVIIRICPQLYFSDTLFS